LGRKSIALILLLLFASAGYLLADEIGLDGSVGFGNCYRPGEWTPVTVWGDAAEPISGRLVIEIVTPDWPPARYIQPVRLTNKPVPHTLYVLMPEYPLEHVQVRFVASGRTRAKLEIGRLEPLAPATPLVVNFTHYGGKLAVLNRKALGFAHAPWGLSLAIYSKGANAEAPSPGG